MTSAGEDEGRAVATTLATDNGSLLAAALAAEAYERGGRRATEDTVAALWPDVTGGGSGVLTESG